MHHERLLQSAIPYPARIFLLPAMGGNYKEQKDNLSDREQKIDFSARDVIYLEIKFLTDTTYFRKNFP
jgi:hypothetical protein